MASMITVAEIETLFGRTLTAAETAEVELYIELAIGEVEAWLGRPVTIQTFTNERQFPDANGAVYLKNTPVISVTGLVVNGASITSPPPDEFVTITPYGLDNIFEQTLDIQTTVVDEIDQVALYGAEVIVSYTAGLDFPGAVKSLITLGVLNKLRKEDANRARTNASAVGVKKIVVEDHEIEYERPLASSRSSGTSSILIFESETDFFPIRRLKRRSIT